MRRQLRASGGITNARQGYGIGSWVKERVRKLIPNELASVAVKAAPFVAMLPGYGPLAAGIMRGVGRFDQRGSISDALKQGVGTYAGGKLFGEGMKKFAGRPEGGSAIDSLKNAPKKFMEKGSEFLNKGIDTLNKSGTAGEILKGQLVVGGGTAILSYIASQFAEDPQQPGESYSEYMARRKPIVEKNLKMYLGQSNPGMSQEDLDKLVQQNLAEYVRESNRTSNNKGGRVGYQTGGISMTNTLAQNIAANRAQAMANQNVLQQARQRLSAQRMNQNLPTNLDQINITNMSNRIRHENLDQATGGARGVAANVTGPPTQNDISAAIAANRAPKPIPKTYRNVSPEAQVLNMSQSTYKDIVGSGADPRQYYMDYQNRMMAGNPNLLKYGQVIGGPGMMMAGPGTGPGATPPTQAQVNQMMQNNPMGYMDFDDLVKQYSSTDPYMNFKEEIKDMVDGRDTGYMSAQDYYDINVLGLDGKGIAEKYGIPYALGGRVGFSDGSNLKIKLKEIGYEDTLLDTMSIEELRKLLDSELGTFTDSSVYRPGAAVGGIMSMPMGEPRVNKGGVTELDYRAKGGFVPVGIKEKADDVPAMLSKNEFVFTADAVRGAGNGSIENGAQKMYDTMKNLERRVT